MGQVGTCHARTSMEGHSCLTLLPTVLLLPVSRAWTLLLQVRQAAPRLLFLDVVPVIPRLFEHRTNSEENTKGVQRCLSFLCLVEQRRHSRDSSRLSWGVEMKRAFEVPGIG